jgi:hypothetical protein
MFNAQECAQQAAPPPPSEEKISVFWRVFGGTLLSIAALVCMTIYQQFSASLTDLRAGINHLNEFYADVVKKDELKTHSNAIWTSLKELGNDVLPLKTQTTVIQGQLQAIEQERKDLAREVQQLRERLATLEGHHTGLSSVKASCPDQNGTGAH